MKTRVRYHIEPTQWPVWAAVGCMALSIALRLVWCIRWPEQLAGSVLYVQAILPLAACVLFIILLLACGKKALWTTIIPLLMGVVFFLLKAGTFAPLHQVLCTLLYLLVAVLYGLAVTGALPIRVLLFPLFGLPLAFHIIVEDGILYRTVYTMAEWFQEWSVLCIMAGLLFVAIGMRKTTERIPQAG